MERARRSASEPQPEDGSACLPDADLDVFLPRADDDQSESARGHTKAAQAYPSQGREQCRRVAVPQRLVSLGMRRGGSNYRRLDMNWRRSSSNRSGGFVGDHAAWPVEGQLQSPRTVTRISLVGSYTSMRATPNDTAFSLSIRGRGETPAIHWPSGSNTAPAGLLVFPS